jgi:hypothetical protein
MSSKKSYTEYWRWTTALALSVFVFGCKLIQLKKYSVSLPFWDEWDSNGPQLLKPFYENSLSFDHFFSLHNEHRILIPRIFSLLLLGANEIWDPQLLMVANAFICSVTVALVYKFISHEQEYFHSVLLAISIGFIFAVPFSWTSLLVAFQSQFFLMIIFSILSFWMFSQHEPLSRKWNLGVFYALCAYLSLSSGLLGLPAVIGGIIIVVISSGQSNKREISALVILVALFVLGYAIHINGSGQGDMGAKSLAEFFVSFGKSLAWPYTDRPILAILMFAPFICVLLVMVMRSGIDARKNMFLIILGIFILGQTLAIAYIRGAGGNSPANRYVELLIFGPLINFASLIHLSKIAQKWKLRKYFYWASSTWVLIALMGLGAQAQLVFSNGLVSWHSQNIIAKNNISNYVKTRDKKHLENKPGFQISYPAPDNLIKILDDETLRDVIPFTAEGKEDRWQAGKLRHLTEGLMNVGVWILLLGIALMAGATIMGWLVRDRFP